MLALYDEVLDIYKPNPQDVTIITIGYLEEYYKLGCVEEKTIDGTGAG